MLGTAAGRFVRIASVVLASFAALGLLGAAYQGVADASDLHRYPAPGRLVDVGGFRLHLLCIGRGAPTVVLEASHGGTVAHWVRVQRPLADATHGTVCAYDRAGAGWSDPGPEPRDVRHMAAELDMLLAEARVARPIVLVAHSFGGLVARIFAAEHPRDVTGVVLLEGLAPDTFIRQGLAESTANGLPLPLDGAGVAARLGLLRITGFPPADAALPAEEYAEARTFQSSSKFGDLLAATERSFSTSLAQARASGPLGDIPLLVVLGGASEAGDPLLRALQEEQARLSTRGMVYVVDGASHNGLVTSAAYAPSTVEAVARFITATPN